MLKPVANGNSSFRDRREICKAILRADK